MNYKQLIVCLLVVFVCVTGCVSVPVKEGPRVKPFSSVKEAAKFMASDIDKKFQSSNKSIVFGFFTTLDEKNCSLLCKQLEEYLRIYLKCKQTINYEKYLKLKQYWATIGSYDLVKNEAIKMYLNTAHCLVTGTLVLKEHNNVIDILVTGNDSLTGTQLFSTEAALDYSNPDIRQAWEEKELVEYGTGFAQNESMAYQAAKILCGLDFVKRYVPARIVEKTTINDKEIASHIVEQHLEGWVHPGIGYEDEDQLKIPIKQTRSGKYKATIECKLKQSQLDEWVQTQAAAAGLTLKNQ